MKAIWQDQVVADSDQTIVVEGNHYFPQDSINFDYLEASQTQTVCPWKGQASYYNLVWQDKISTDAAWYYPNPNEAAAKIKDHLAFTGDVEVVES